MTTHPITEPLRIGRPPQPTRWQRARRIVGWLAIKTFSAIWVVWAVALGKGIPAAFPLLLLLGSIACGPQRPKRPARPWSTAPRRMSTLLLRRLVRARAGAAVTSSPHE